MSEDYPSISEYAFLSDCHSAALISRAGSVDWLCMPRLDSASCFGRLLGWKNGGYCKISPTGDYSVSRRYLADTLILETTFAASEGKVRLLDCFTMRIGGQHNPFHQLVRTLEVVEGKVEIEITVEPVFDYGAVKAWIRPYSEGAFAAMGGSHGLLISADMPLRLIHRHALSSIVTLSEGERRRLSICRRAPEDIEEQLVDVPRPEEIDSRVEQTVDWWKKWTSQGNIDCPYPDQVRRSAIVLKGLSHAPSGAIAAAATTSLPETPGGSRNWDYRYSWIRDSCFAVGSLAELGYVKESDGFRRFMERSAAGSADQLQVLFGIGGERRIHEFEIEELEGYRGAKPVRTGNAASSQLQLDAFGDIVDLARDANLRNAVLEDHYWDFLVQVIDRVAYTWKEPDRGIWEVRGAPRHFTHSKVMCWFAVAAGITIAEDRSLSAPLRRWREVRDEIRRMIEYKAYDRERGVFTQAFDFPKMDSALLLMPKTGFVQYTDDRFVRTTDAIREELCKDGLLLRYLPGDDGLHGDEGCFLACSFWLALCLARQGRTDEAREVFERTLSTGNDLGLFSEEYDLENAEMLGNFPQGLTHLSLIEAAVALKDSGQECGTS